MKEHRVRKADLEDALGEPEAVTLIVGGLAGAGFLFVGNKDQSFAIAAPWSRTMEENGDITFRQDVDAARQAARARSRAGL